MRTSRTRPDQLIDFVLHVPDACPQKLSASAWKVVSFVATRVFVPIRDEWRSYNDPVSLLDKDISTIWTKYPKAPASLQENPQFEVFPSDSPDDLPNHLGGSNQPNRTSPRNRVAQEFDSRSRRRSSEPLRVTKSD